MPTLLTLPIEIIQLILEECDVWVHFHFMYVSRDARSVAMPFLYRTTNVWATGSWSCRTVQLYLRSLAENPQLPRLVHEVKLSPTPNPCFLSSTDTYLWHEEGEEVDMAIHGQAMTLLQAMQFDDLASWSEDLETGSLDPWLALLISQLPNLRSLCLSPSLLHKSNYMRKVLTHLMKPGSEYFSRLQHVQYEGDEMAPQAISLDVDRDAVLPLLSLPALKQLNLTLYKPSIAAWPVGIRSSSLDTLTFTKSYITAEDVDAMLRRTPNLTNLCCGFLREDITPLDSERVDLRELCSALTHVSGTLSELKLEVRWGRRYENRGSEALSNHASALLLETPVPSFQSFTALKKLVIPFGFVVNGSAPHRNRALIGLIPRNLQTLILTDNQVMWNGAKFLDTDYYLEDIIDSLEEYLLGGQEYAPVLQNVGLHLALQYNGECPFQKIDVDDNEDNEDENQYYPPEAVHIRAIALASRVDFSVMFENDESRWELGVYAHTQRDQEADCVLRDIGYPMGVSAS